MTSQATRPLRAAIFGATSGIAVAVARRLASSGARLVLVGRDAAAITASVGDLKVRGAAEVVEIICDFSEIGQLGPAVNQAWQAFSGLDLALVAYGTLPDQGALEADPVAIAPMLTLNLTSPAVLASQLAPHFEAQRSGVLAVITSVAGDRGRKSNFLYGAAKGGLQRLLEGLRHRLHAAGVQVLDIRPGFVSTRMTEHLPRGGPLWAEPDKVAGDILRAVERRRAVLYTPWFWRLILLIVRSLPRPLFHRTSF
jgi:decaprenylphospho-beta-D-erythro-pentofuranosid-2-ulose 2-reductase